MAFLNISFTHHVAILTHAKTLDVRKFYVQYAADYKVITGLSAITMFKDEYLLDFINVGELFVRDKDWDERMIGQSILKESMK